MLTRHRTRSRRRRLSALLLWSLPVVLGALVVSACEPRRVVNGWWPYWETDGGRLLTSDGDLVSELSPFWFATTNDPRVIARTGGASSLATATSTARSLGIAVLPTIADGTGKGVVAGWFGDPAKRAQHVQAIVDLVVDSGYDGIDIDYENFAFVDGRDTWPTTQPRWVQFVTDLGAALHAEGKLLSVTVPPIWAGGASGYTVYAWAQIEPHIDRLRIMVYDWSFSTAGPIAPISWVEDVVDYAKSVVPMEKVQVGVPTYGRNWATVRSGDVCPVDADLARRSVQQSAAAALAAAKGATPVRDASSGEMRFTWNESFTGPAPTTTTTTTVPPTSVALPGIDRPALTPTTVDGLALATRAPLTTAPSVVTCQVTRTVWHPDVTSVQQKAQVAMDAGASGVFVWALGFEASDLADALRPLAELAPRPAGTTPLGNIDTVSAAPGQVNVTGWGLDPETDLPVLVDVLVTNGPSATVVARVSRPDVATVHQGMGRFHGFATSIRVNPGPQQVCVRVHGWGTGPGAVDLGCRTVEVPVLFTQSATPR